MTRSFRTMDGNEAVASVAYRTHEVIATYPITLSTLYRRTAPGRCRPTIPSCAVRRKTPMCSFRAAKRSTRTTPLMCSALLQHGIGHLRTVEEGIRACMEEHKYASVRQMQGSMSQQHCADASAFERAQYMRALNTYRPV